MMKVKNSYSFDLAVLLRLLVVCVYFILSGSECFASTPGTVVISPGISVISLPKVRVVIKEIGCNPKLCPINDTEESKPIIKIKSIVAYVEIKGHQKKYLLPSQGMFDAWGGGRDENINTKYREFGATCYDENNCVLRGVFGDGAETFVAQWEISDGHVERTVFTAVSDVVDLFRSHIDPPSNVYD